MTNKPIAPSTNAMNMASGVRAISGYSTAPQCVPSRGGLLTGRFQSRFGLESNNDSLDGFNAETTIAERLQACQIEVLRPQQLPPGDGAVAAGQAACAACRLTSRRG